MPFGSLWLPVVVSAVVVWFASAVLHMLLGYHKADYRGLPNEEAVGEPLRKTGLPAGYYVLPYCPDPKQMKDPAVQERYAKGPVAMIALLPNGVPNLGKHLAEWFGLCILISFVVAYVARHTLQLSTDGMTVMRITTTVAFAGYALGYVQDSIWKAMPWGNSIRGMVDGLIYSVLTGIVFTLLWPA